MLWLLVPRAPLGLFWGLLTFCLPAPSSEHPGFVPRTPAGPLGAGGAAAGLTCLSSEAVSPGWTWFVHGEGPGGPGRVTGGAPGVFSERGPGAGFPRGRRGLAGGLGTGSPGSISWGGNGGRMAWTRGSWGRIRGNLSSAASGSESSISPGFHTAEDLPPKSVLLPVEPRSWRGFPVSLGPWPGLCCPAGVPRLVT